MVVKEKLFAYFRNKENKYVLLSNGTKVKLAYVSGVGDRELNLMFEHAHDNIKIKFHFYTPEHNTMTIMEIPEGYYNHTQVRVESMNHVGFIINETLSNWIESKDVIGLEWSD